MNTSRKKYRRSLKVHGLVRLVVLGTIAAGVACAFVVVKNRQHTLANERRAILNQMSLFEKEIKTYDLRIAAMTERQAIAERLRTIGHTLVKIEHAEEVIAGVEGRTQFASYRGSRSEAEGF